MEVKEIILTFENCERMTFPRKVIGDLIISDITKTIARTAMNSISDYMCAKTVVMEIFFEGDTVYHPFDISNENDRKFDRIKRYNDITHIDIKYEDDTIESYLVDYGTDHDGLGEENACQQTYISTLGNLYVVIKKRKTIGDYFDMDQIEDEEYISSLKKILREKKENTDKTSDIPGQMYITDFIEEPT